MSIPSRKRGERKRRERRIAAREKNQKHASGVPAAGGRRTVVFMTVTLNTLLGTSA